MMWSTACLAKLYGVRESKVSGSHKDGACLSRRVKYVRCMPHFLTALLGCWTIILDGHTFNV